MAFKRREVLQAIAVQLYGYAVSLCADPTLAEDLAQETIARAIGARRAPTEAKAFRAWTFRILRNAFIDHTRRTGRLVSLDASDMTEAVDGHATNRPGVFDDSLINSMTVRFAWTRLKASQREIIGLVDVAGFSYAEAAELLNIPIGTVMSRLSRARAELANAIVNGNVVPMPRSAGRRP